MGVQAWLRGALDYGAVPRSLALLTAELQLHTKLRAALIDGLDAAQLGHDVTGQLRAAVVAGMVKSWARTGLTAQQLPSLLDDLEKARQLHSMHHQPTGIN